MEIRTLESAYIEDTVCRLFSEANRTLSPAVCRRLSDAQKAERNPLAASILEKLQENLQAAREMNLPMCQDTGMAVVFAEIGQDVHITGGTLREAVDAGVRRAYRDGPFRASVVGDPFYERVNTTDNTPAVLYTELVPGDTIRLTVIPKGFGSENMSAIRMFTPSATEADIRGFVQDTVQKAGANPCPPVVVGIGIGGTFEYAALLAKKALLREPDCPHNDPRYAALEAKILKEINALAIGPQGFGGDTTALSVAIETYPTHIAGLPVAVNLCCHMLRHKTAVI